VLAARATCKRPARARPRWAGQRRSGLALALCPSLSGARPRLRSLSDDGLHADRSLRLLPSPAHRALGARLNVLDVRARAQGPGVGEVSASARAELLRPRAAASAGLASSDGQRRGTPRTRCGGVSALASGRRSVAVVADAASAKRSSPPHRGQVPTTRRPSAIVALFHARWHEAQVTRGGPMLGRSAGEPRGAIDHLSTILTPAHGRPKPHRHQIVWNRRTRTTA